MSNYKDCHEKNYQEVRKLCKKVRKSTKDINLRLDKKSLCDWLVKEKVPTSSSCNKKTYQEVRTLCKTLRKSTNDINLNHDKKTLCNWLVKQSTQPSLPHQTEPISCNERPYKEVQRLCKKLRKNTKDINLNSDKKTLCDWLFKNNHPETATIVNNQTLRWTHNMPYEILLGMIRKTYKRYIRCCDESGAVLKRGAQFRYGLDSQYGDIMFVMNNTSWWQDKRGYDVRTNNITKRPMLGHVFKDNFATYDGENIKTIDSRLLEEANNYTYRSPNVSGDGTECMTVDNNGLSWCNTQLHLSENIDFKHVDFVLAPRWIVDDSNINIPHRDLLIKVLTNKLPKLKDLNGKFVLYGPSSIHEHYQWFNPGYVHMEDYYPTLKRNLYKEYGSTARDNNPLGNSSNMAVSTIAFTAAEKIYMTRTTNLAEKRLRT